MMETHALKHGTFVTPHYRMRNVSRFHITPATAYRSSLRGFPEGELNNGRPPFSELISPPISSSSCSWKSVRWGPSVTGATMPVVTARSAPFLRSELRRWQRWCGQCWRLPTHCGLVRRDETSGSNFRLRIRSGGTHRGEADAPGNDLHPHCGHQYRLAGGLGPVGLLHSVCLLAVARADL